MKAIVALITLMLVFFSFDSLPGHSQTAKQRPILYVLPKANAVRVSPTTALAISVGTPLHARSLIAGAFRVVGSQSGLHTGRTVLSDDQLTLLFYPDLPFAYGERVLVSIQPRLMTAAGALVASASYQFTVTVHPITSLPPTATASLATAAPLAPVNAAPAAITPPRYYTHPEFAQVMTATVTTPAQSAGTGYLFMASMGLFFDGQRALTILDNTGEPLYIQPTPNDKIVTNFRKQTVKEKAFLTYNLGENVLVWTNGAVDVMDETYTVVDHWTIGNGYESYGADEHEFLLLDNGHAILLSYVPIPYNLEPFGGPADGILIDIVLQEQDSAKNVVFEWHGSEHIPVAETYHDLTDSSVDFMHTNAIAVDSDGNWLISSRNMAEITKINRQTGAVIWRLGGKGNQFTFTNDSGFWRQHDIRRLPNGHLTLFDNGNQHTPPHSRALEYAVDETAKTVTRIWQYPNDTSEYSFIMGNVQRLDNGNTVIGWGDRPKVTEVRSDGTIALEVAMGGPSYRAFRDDWQATPAAAPRAVVLYSTDPTTATLYTSWNGATEITGYGIYAGPTPATLTPITTADRTGFETRIDLNNLPADTCFFQTEPLRGQALTQRRSNLIFRTDLPRCREQLAFAYLPLVALSSGE